MSQGASPDSARFSASGWQQQGFKGFSPLSALPPSKPPAGGGVYAILRASSDPPVFVAISTGGSFKGRDPTVAREILTENWIPDVDTIYIGRAIDLKKRLSQYRRFGNGKRVGHWGGRYIWQLADASELTVCWKEFHRDPGEVESELIAEFTAVFGRRPFANLVNGKG